MGSFDFTTIAISPELEMALGDMVGIQLIGGATTMWRSDCRNRLVIDIAWMFAKSMPVIRRIHHSDKMKYQAGALDAAKIICEVCLFFHRSNSIVSTEKELVEQIGGFVSEALDLLVTQELLDYVHNFPSAVNLVALVVLCGKTYGLESRRLVLLECAFRSPAYLSTERSTFRYQEMVWLREKITGQALSDSRPCTSALLARTTHPCVLRREDLYAKTHTAMYETDFGRKRIDPLYRNDAIVEGLLHDLNFSFCNADWDLVGEICMVCRYLEIDGRLWAGHLKAIQSVWRKFSFIPSITFDTKYARTLDHREVDLYEFVHSYHSTLVFALLLISEGDELDVPCNGESSSSSQDAVEISDVLAAINQFFGPQEFELGPISPNWYARDISITAECLVDGYTTKCYHKFGRNEAALFVDSIPNAKELALVRSTYDYIDRI
jgi:hypothetical protein